MSYETTMAVLVVGILVGLAWGVVEYIVHARN